MAFKYSIKNQTGIYTATIYSQSKTNTPLYDSPSASSSNIVFQSDTTTIFPSPSASNEIGSTSNYLTSSYNYISFKPVISFNSQQPSVSSSLESISSTLTNEISSSIMFNVQSTYSTFSQQGHLSSSLLSTNSFSRISSSDSSSISEFTSTNFYTPETSSFNSQSITSSSSTSSTDSQYSSTGSNNFVSIKSPISSFITYITTSINQQQSSFNSFRQNPLWSTSEISTTSQPISSSKSTPTTFKSPVSSAHIHVSSFTRTFATSQYSSYSLPIKQSISTTKTLIKSSMNTTASFFASNKTPTLKLNQTTSSTISPSVVLSSPTATSKCTSTNPSKLFSTLPSSSTSSLSVSSYQNYFTYTQEYYFTGKTTSFTTGIPITVTFSQSDTNTYSPLSTTAVITAPMEVYNKWINGGGLDPTDTENNGTANNSTGTNNKTIIGSVVGVVGGVILCSIIVWLVLFKRKKYNKNWNNKLSLGNNRKSEGMTSKLMPSPQSFTHPKGYSVNYNSTDNTYNDPFKPKFEFDNRYNINGAPPVPAPRKNKTSNNKEYSGVEIPTVKSTAGNNDRDNYHLRFSYVSSETDSSFNSSAFGSFSTISPSPNKYGTMGDDRQGFLREIL